MNHKIGTALDTEDRDHLLRAFVHRYTGEHKPDWASRPMPGESEYPVQFLNDQDWLAHTYFRVRADGRLDMRARRCESHPTWPAGRVEGVTA